MSEKIIDLLKPDSKVIDANLNSIFGKELEYAAFLYAIEKSVSNEFLNNKKIKDREIIKYLKCFLKNIEKEKDYFKSNFEKVLYTNIIDILDKKKITKHELTLCVKYVLWSIDNRSWLNDSQAYVKWLAHSTGVMNSSEKRVYEKRIRILCRRKGIPDNQIEAMLRNNFSNIEIEDKERTDIECEFFALSDDRKYDFAIDNFNETPLLFEIYYYELMEDKNYDLAENLCKEILEKVPDFPLIEIMLGIVYKEKGNTIIAKYHFKNTLKVLDDIPEYVISLSEKNKMTKEVKSLLKDIS